MGKGKTGGVWKVLIVVWDGCKSKGGGPTWGAENVLELLHDPKKKTPTKRSTLRKTNPKPRKVNLGGGV